MGNTTFGISILVVCHAAFSRCSKILTLPLTRDADVASTCARLAYGPRLRLPVCQCGESESAGTELNNFILDGEVPRRWRRRLIRRWLLPSQRANSTALLARTLTETQA